MLKVVLIVKQVAIRLKECTLDILIRQKDHDLPLVKGYPLQNGFSTPNETTQFYVHPWNSNILINLLLHVGQDSKYGGQVKLNLQDWEPNVLHNNISQINKSPDKQARLFFTFYYFHDQSVQDDRPLFLSTDKYYSEYQNMKLQTKILNSQKQELQNEVNTWEVKNQKLEENQQELKKNLDQRQFAHKNTTEKFYDNISGNNQELQNQKEVKNKLFDLAKDSGLIERRGI